MPDRFGTEGSKVQILSPRPLSSQILSKNHRQLSACAGSFRGSLGDLGIFRGSKTPF